MSLHSGFSRINLLVRWAAYVSLIGAAASFFVGATSNEETQRWFFAAVLLAATGAGLYGVQWIVAGFLQQDRELKDTAPQSGAVGQVSKAIALRWLIVGGAILIGCFIVFREGGSYAIGGYLAAVLMLLALTAAIGFRRKPGQATNQIPALAFATLAVLWAVKTHYEGYNERMRSLSQVQAARQVIEATISNTSPSVTTLQDVGNPIPSDPSDKAKPEPGILVTQLSPPTSGGDMTMAEMTEKAKAIATRRDSIEQRFESALGGIDVDKWLGLDPVLRADVRATYRAEIGRATSALRVYERDSVALMDDIESQATISQARGPEGQAFARGIQRNAPKSRQLTNTFIRAYRNFLEAPRNLYDFLDDPATGYTVKDQKIWFSKTEDKDRYRKYFEDAERAQLALQRIAADVDRARTEMQQAARQKLLDAENKLSAPVPR